MHAIDPAAHPVPDTFNTPRIGSVRVAVGLIQGLVLYLLYRASTAQTWPATEPRLFDPLVVAWLLVPVILISSVGHITRRQAASWVGTTAILTAALGWYDSWRADTLGLPLPAYAAKSLPPGTYPSPQLGLLLVAGFFIAHSFVLAGVRERRRIASYASHFEIAWKLGVQLAFSALFVGVTWLVLNLGAELFKLVRLTFLSEYIRESWFAIPVTTFAFACAMHLTDVRPAIVRGIRTLLLVLTSWILPVMTLLVGGFLLSLPFTGLAPLWATRHAGTVLLFADAVFVVLINAAWQDGAALVSAARVVRASARVAAVLLVPLTALAIHALALRVREYGWTDDRVYAAACMLVASCYALGYAFAAVRGSALRQVAGVNVASAFVVLATLLLLLSPVADPARLSVNDQLARLASGKVAAEKFDFVFLRFAGMRYGREALLRLDATASGKDAAVIRQGVAAARKLTAPWEGMQMALPPASIGQNLQIWPKGAVLPPSFLRADLNALRNAPDAPDCLRDRTRSCDAFVLDVTGDGAPEIILMSAAGAPVVIAETRPGQWQRIARLPFWIAGCDQLRNAMKAGQFHTVPPSLQDISVGGQRIGLLADDGIRCKPEKRD